MAMMTLHADIRNQAASFVNLINAYKLHSHGK